MSTDKKTKAQAALAYWLKANPGWEQGSHLAPGWIDLLRAIIDALPDDPEPPKPRVIWAIPEDGRSWLSEESIGDHFKPMARKVVEVLE